MEPAIQEANTSAKTRANEAVASMNREGYTAPDVAKIEAPAQTLTVPPGQTEIGAIEQFTSITPEMLQQQRELNRAQAQQTDTLGDIYAGLSDIGTKGARTIEAERKAGIPELQTGLVEIENEIASKSLAFRREREKIEQQGGSVGQVNALLSDVSRKQNRELADLEVIRSARSNTLTNAQNLINRQIELEFGDKIAQVNALKFIYDENKEKLTDQQDKLFQQTIKREERAFQVAADDYKNFVTEKNKYLTNAAQAGADNNTLKAIQGVQSRDELYSMDGIQRFALSQAERLEIQAKRQSIYSSAVATRLALANAGDPGAIKELGFDPRKIEAEAEKLDPTTKRQLEEKLSGSNELLTLLKDYRAIVEENGYTMDNGLFGNPALVGKIDGLRSQITSAYRKAEQLGTLDQGVLNLMAQLIGERPVTTLTGWGAENQNMFANVTGGQARKLVASLDEVIETTEAKKAEAEFRLGRNPLIDAQFSAEENAALNAEFGVEGQSGVKIFDPNEFYK